MKGQTAYGWWASSKGIHTYSATVQVKNRDTFAEVALTRVNDISEGDGVWGQIGITQVVSDSGVETFNVRQAIYRKNVTSVTVQLFVWNSFARGRLFLNYWS